MTVIINVVTSAVQESNGRFAWTMAVSLHHAHHTTHLSNLPLLLN